MFRRTLLVFALAALVSGGLTAAVGASNAPSGRYIVRFADEASARAEIAHRGGGVIAEVPLIGGAVVSLPERAAGAIARHAAFRSVEADATAFALKPPAGCTPWPECKGGGDPVPPPAQTVEWGVDRIDAELAWASSKGAAVKVAVIDTGIDADHPDLAANLRGGANFVSKSPVKPADISKWDDDNGHGTHVAGIIAAADNGQGVVGVAPEAQLYAVKVLDRSGSGYVSAIIQGLQWAVDNGMQVANMSLGTSSDVQALHDAVDAAEAAGLLVVAAAGNSGDGDPATDDVEYPGKYASVMAVAATASDDSSPSWSSEGAEVEIAAPGVAIRSTWNDGGYAVISGTSMASPHVAGAAALLIAGVPGSWDADADGAWDPSEVRTALIATADDLGASGRDAVYGNGLVDAEEAVTGTQTNP